MWWNAAVIVFVALTSFISLWQSKNGAKNWYQRIITPSGTPSVTVLRFFWLVFYALYAWALIIYLNKMAADQTYLWWETLSFVAVGLLGVAWVKVFFGAHRIMPAIYISALMAFIIFCSAFGLFNSSLLATALTAVYMVWIGYITRISYLIWELNP